MPIRTQRGYKILKACLNLLRKNHKLMLFPLLGGALSLLILFIILTPIHAMGHLHQPLTSAQWHKLIILYVIFIIFLFFAHLIFMLCNVGYINGLTQVINKQPVNLKRCFSAIKTLFWKVLLWKCYTSTVGSVLHLGRLALKDFPFVKTLLRGQLWRIATYFTLPIIIHQALTPSLALKRSSTMITERWGAPVKTSFRFGFIFSLLKLISFIPVAFGLYSGNATAVYMGAIITSAALLVINMILNSAHTFFKWALYLYLEKGIVAFGLQETLLQNAFEPMNIDK